MKKLLKFLLVLLVCNICTSQEIVTTFAINGYLTSEPSPYTKNVIKFKKKKECKVINYIGGGFWKISYKKKTGYTSRGYLKITNEMTKLVNVYDYKARVKDSTDKANIRIKITRVRDSIDDVKKRQKRKRFVKDSLRKDAIKQEIELKEQKVLSEKRNNCHYSKNGIDEFDNIKIITTEYYGITKATYLDNYYPVNIKFHKYGSTKWVFIDSNADLGCVSGYDSSRSYVKIKLENNDIIKLNHSGDVDCSNFTLNAVLSPGVIKRLKKSPIKSMRMQGTEFYEDYKEIYYPEFFIDKLKCIE